MKEIYDIVAPILKTKGIPAIFFITSSFVDNKNLLFRSKISLIIEEINKNENIIRKTLKEHNLLKSSTIEALLNLNYKDSTIIDKLYNNLNKSFSNYLKKEKPYLTTKQIIELHNDGFHIGAHAKTHRRFSEITTNQQITETLESIDFIKKIVNPKHSLFAFPFTDNKISKSFFNEIYASKKIDISFGTAGLKNDTIKRNIQRIPMENNLNASETIKYQYLYYLIKIPFRKNLIKRK